MHALPAAMLALSLVLLARPGHAASFDCAAAHTAAERMVCGDPALSALDEKLASTFADTVAVVPHAEPVRQEQREWLVEQRDKAADTAAMRSAYQARIDVLRALADEARAVPKEVDAAALQRGCVAVRHEADETCRIESAGSVASRLLYQVQGYYDGDLRTAGGIIVLTQEETPGKLRVVLWDAADSTHYYEPEIIASPAGNLLEVPGSVEGTGNFNAGSLYREGQAGWQEINTASWQRELAARLPKGRAVWKEVYPNWRTMTAETSLWRPGDGNCCPTAGSARVTLALRGDRIVLTGLQVSDRPLP